VTSVPIRLPWIAWRELLVSRTTPMPWPEMTLPAPAAVPPIVLSEELPE
jgi:hypothetical protein